MTPRKHCECTKNQVDFVPISMFNDLFTFSPNEKSWHQQVTFDKLSSFSWQMQRVIKWPTDLFDCDAVVSGRKFELEVDRKSIINVNLIHFSLFGCVMYFPARPNHYRQLMKGRKRLCNHKILISCHSLILIVNKISTFLLETKGNRRLKNKKIPNIDTEHGKSILFWWFIKYLLHYPALSRVRCPSVDFWCFCSSSSIFRGHFLGMFFSRLFAFCSVQVSWNEW